jgi:hypothetical protein
MRRLRVSQMASVKRARLNHDESQRTDARLGRFPEEGGELTNRRMLEQVDAANVGMQTLAQQLLHPQQPQRVPAGIEKVYVDIERLFVAENFRPNLTDGYDEVRAITGAHL